MDPPVGAGGRIKSRSHSITDSGLVALIVQKFMGPQYGVTRIYAVSPQVGHEYSCQIANAVKIYIRLVCLIFVQIVAKMGQVLAQINQDKYVHMHCTGVPCVEVLRGA